MLKGLKTALKAKSNKKISTGKGDKESVSKRNGKSNKKSVFQALKKKKNKDHIDEREDSVLQFAGEKDFAPSSVIEVAPGDERRDGEKTLVASDYYVEIGATLGDARYLKTFYAVFSGTHTWDGMFNSLYAGEFGDGDVDTSIRIDPANTTSVLHAIARRIAGLESDYTTVSGNQAKLQAIEIEIDDLKRQQRRLRMNEEKIFKVSLHTTASSLSYKEMRRIANAVVKKFAAVNVHLRSCDFWQVDALLHSTPLRKRPENRFFRTLESSCVADFFPFGLGGLSHREGIIVGFDPMGHPVFFDGWHSRLDGYNMVILGRTGSGKSFTIKLVTMRSALMGIQTAIIDPQMEYRPMAEAMGCPYITLAPGSPDQINVFDVEAQTDENGHEFLDIEGAARSALPVIYKMLRSIEPGAVTGVVKNQLQEAIYRLYSERGITEDPESLYVESQGYEVERERKLMPTLSDLYLMIKKNADDSNDTLMLNISEYLRPFTKQGVSSHQAIFDCQTSVNLGNYPFFVFSLAALQEDEVMKPIGLYIATKWIWEKFGKRNVGTKKRIIVDEAHLLMNDQESADWMIAAFKMARKNNTSMCAVTQGFSDLMGVPNGVAILQNASVKILLKQDSVDMQSVSERLNLSQGERNFLLMAPKGGGIVRAGNEAVQVQFTAFQQEFDLYNTDPNIKGVVKYGKNEGQVASL